jgi:hypothetical protein
VKEKTYATYVSSNGSSIFMVDYTGLYFKKKSWKVNCSMETAHGYLPSHVIEELELKGTYPSLPTTEDISEFSKTMYRLLDRRFNNKM